MGFTWNKDRSQPTHQRAAVQCDRNFSVVPWPRQLPFFGGLEFFPTENDAAAITQDDFENGPAASGPGLGIDLGGKGLPYCRAQGILRSFPRSPAHALDNDLNGLKRLRGRGWLRARLALGPMCLHNLGRRRLRGPRVRGQPWRFFFGKRFSDLRTRPGVLALEIAYRQAHQHRGHDRGKNDGNHFHCTSDDLGYHYHSSVKSESQGLACLNDRKCHTGLSPPGNSAERNLTRTNFW
jgi:hypothetical protein